MSDMIDLDQLEQELDDIETALSCLSKSGDELCVSCRNARADGTLHQRVALAACAAGKLPTEAQLDLR